LTGTSHDLFACEASLFGLLCAWREVQILRQQDDCKPIKTPMPTNGHLDLDEGGKSVDQKLYHSMIGSLLILPHLGPISCLAFVCVLGFKPTLKNLT
jgi:hypothetical protein